MRVHFKPADNPGKYEGDPFSARWKPPKDFIEPYKEYRDSDNPVLGYDIPPVHLIEDGMVVDSLGPRVDGTRRIFRPPSTTHHPFAQHVLEERAKKEEGIARRFAERFESELRKLHEGLSRRRTRKGLDSVWQRIGRIQERCRGAGQHYTVDVVADPHSGKAVARTCHQIDRLKYLKLSKCSATR